ncbi:hypothetical protein [Enterococcus faecium]|uniref:hypothetical protein n=1 Tax=Enterococcus faecium TaxID=1352 RepID=UPI000BF192A3|nr:hypothetical protein [Enterococcus faecium]PEH49559.1 hypothetical protein CRM75_01225 [Enterococcus faecium]
MPDFTAFNKQNKKETLDEMIDQENMIHNKQKHKEISSATPSKMPMPTPKNKEVKEPTYLMLKNKTKLRKLAEASDMSMAELVDFWIENA